jgi:hypothetical protein
MPGRWGLQAKMTASYVLVTAAAVVLVEAVVLGIVVPGLVTRADGTTLVQRTAVDYANTAMQRSASLGRLRRLAAATVCHAYRERLGVTVEADLEPVELAPAAEHAVLRVVQEALANAVKHARPNRIRLQLLLPAGR